MSARTAITPASIAGAPVALGLGEHPHRHAVGQREQDAGDLVGVGAAGAGRPRPAWPPAVRRRARACGAAARLNSAAISSLRRESVNSSKISVTKSGSSRSIDSSEPRRQVDEVVGGRSAARAARRAAPCAGRSRGERPRRGAAPWCRSSSAAARARRRPRAPRGRTSSRPPRAARPTSASHRRSARPSRRSAANGCLWWWRLPSAAIVAGRPASAAILTPASATATARPGASAISSGSSSIATRSCSSESRSRSVTVRFSSDSWSMVTQYGVPISSWRR